MMLHFYHDDLEWTILTGIKFEKDILRLLRLQNRVDIVGYFLYWVITDSIIKVLVVTILQQIRELFDPVVHAL